VDVAEQEVAALLPPQRSLGRALRPAEAMARCSIGSEVEMIFSSSGASCSMRGVRLLSDMANPPIDYVARP
jgi:hypothetical protein